MTTETAERFDPAYPVAKLHESKWNPRKTYNAAKMAELEASVRAKGVITPLLVRPNANGCEIGAGHRRYRAAKAADVATVPALIRPMSDEEFLELVIFENDEREDVHPLEEAAGYKTMMTQLGWDVGRIAARTGKSEKYVYDRVKLLALIPEAQKLFLDNLITAGHAILLARLRPEDQKRIVKIDRENYDNEGVLLKTDATLLTPEEEDKLDEKKWPMKAISVRELERWIAEHVRFKPEATDAFLFPQTAAAVQTATEKKEKVVEVTHESFIQEDAREGRTIREGYWKRADGKKGSKTCERSVTGVIVVGPGQGDAFRVCVDRERCTVHWAKEIREKQKRAKQGAKGGTAAETAHDRYKREEERRRQEYARVQAERARWTKALPKILDAVAAAVKKAPTRAAGLLGQILVEGCGDYRNRGCAKSAAFVGLGSTAEDLVRHAAFAVLYGEANDYQGAEQFPQRAKAFGIDVKKILDEVAPVEKAEAAEKKPAQTSAKTKGQRKK